MHHRVELLPSPRRHGERARRQVGTYGNERCEAGSGARQREDAVHAEVATAPLHLVAGGGQRLDPCVDRDHLGDLLPQLLVAGPGEGVAELGAHPRGHVGEQPPLAARLTDLARDLRAEDDPPFGGGLCATSFLLVAGGDREQDDVLSLHEHLRRDHDVLVDAQGHPTEGGRHGRRVGQHLEEVPSRAPEHIDLAAPRRLHHLRGGATGSARHREPPLLAQRGGVLLVYRRAARERRGVGTHLRAALHTRVTPNRHEAGTVATDVAASQPQVDDRPHTVDRVAVLRDPHRPDEHRRARHRRRGRRTPRPAPPSHRPGRGGRRRPGPPAGSRGRPTLPCERPRRRGRPPRGRSGA